LSATVCIPFRDRGRDPLRAKNLECALKSWDGLDVVVVDDGRTGDEQFNRCAAYNRAAQQTDADVLVYAESDMLISHSQIREAVRLAAGAPGVVVPYTKYCYLSEADSQKVRDGADPAGMTPELTIPNEHRNWPRTGPINVMSRATLAAIGCWDEKFEGCWWDDRAMRRAFDIAAGPTRFVNGPAFHLYHLPGWTGPHLTDEDREATQRNMIRYASYVRATTSDEIRALTAGCR
jgi:hypothetical protein